MTSSTHIAIDLGAGSGRVIAGRFEHGRLDLQIVHRFPNRFQHTHGHDRWNTSKLSDEIRRGLKKATGMYGDIISIGVDTWGVDYGLYDRTGKLLEEPVCYRDARTENVMQQVFRDVPQKTLYAKTGTQFLPINTIFQMVAHVRASEWPDATASLLMMPDIFHYAFSGVMRGEYTNASTTGLLNALTKEWDAELLAHLRLPVDVMPELCRPGDIIGALLPEWQQQTGISGVKIVAPATHDTASAVVGTPLQSDWAYISSGTWSLIGVEIDAPILTDRAREQNFTNEGGAFGTIRFLKNVMGLWILECCRQTWDAQEKLLSYEALAGEMRMAPPFQAFINPDELRFLNPSNMVEELRHYLRETGQPVPQSQAALSRVVLESLALRYAEIIAALQDITGRQVRGVHIIGGGCQNGFLNQATADATGLEVIAGPVEATAIGNLMVQAIAAGRFSGIAEARDYLSHNLTFTKYTPKDHAVWQQARKRFSSLTTGISAK